MEQNAEVKRKSVGKVKHFELSDGRLVVTAEVFDADAESLQAMLDSGEIEAVFEFSQAEA